MIPTTMADQPKAPELSTEYARLIAQHLALQEETVRAVNGAASRSQLQSLRHKLLRHRDEIRRFDDARREMS